MQNNREEMYKKSVLHVQSCFFANEWFSSNVRISYAHRIMGSPGGANIASRYKEMYGVELFLRQKQCLGTENAAFCRDFMRSGGD